MTNKEIAQKVVDRMLDTIKTEGQMPWTKPWSTGTEQKTVRVVDGKTTVTIPVEYWSRDGKPYTGINPLLLRVFGKRGEMITYKRCQDEGGHVKKGAKGAPIIFWQMLTKKVETLDDKGNPITKTVQIPLLKTYTVFSVEDDCEGITTKHHPAPITYTRQLAHWEPVDGIDESSYDTGAEAIIADYLQRAATLKLIRDGVSDRAFYRPSEDMVTVPCIKQYTDPSEFYSTLFHELGHSTGHESRLNRFNPNDRAAAWGDENYSREELVAEITAATILNHLGLESGNTFRNSTAYVEGWSRKLREDPMLFVTACSRAEKAIDLILGTTEA